MSGIHRWPTNCPQKRVSNAESICSKFCLTTCIMTIKHISLPAVVCYLHCLYLCTLINPPKGENVLVCYLHFVYRSVASLWMNYSLRDSRVWKVYIFGYYHILAIEELVCLILHSFDFDIFMLSLNFNFLYVNLQIHGNILIKLKLLVDSQTSLL